MDSLSGHTKALSDLGHTNPSNVRSRRGLEGHLAGLALVAPPDAARTSYDHLTPPSSAPITTDGATRGAEVFARDDKGHHRSASEAVGSKKSRKSPRDVGIVGTGQNHQTVDSPTKQQLQSTYTANDALRPPVFQQPHSRSPSPGNASDSSSQLLRSPPQFERRTTGLSIQSILTPEIGQGKEIHVPVAAPVVVNLGSVNAGALDRDRSAPEIVVPRSSSPSSFLPREPSSYLHYQPGECCYNNKRVIKLEC